MRVLILSCSTGGGHNSAAAAISERFEMHGYHCTIVDTLELLPGFMTKVISRGHVFVYRHLPRLFGVGYRFEEHMENPRFIYQQSSLGADDLYRYICANNFDTVICVHVFSALTMTEIRKKYAPDIRVYFVATDYTCSPGVKLGNMDAYFVPRGLSDEFEASGIPRERIVESGIPVRADFYHHKDKKEAKRAFGLRENGNAVLLMCGSMGCGPIYELTECLSEMLPHDTQLAVVCGNNEKLRLELEPLAGDKVKVLGYTKDISLLMDASELVLSKPGGLSSTETLAKELPMICINAVPGCETRNLDFFVKKGYAVTAKGVQALSELVCDYISNPGLAERQKEILGSDFSYPASEVIYEKIAQEESGING